MADPVQTQKPKFIDLGLSNINELDKSNGLSTPATIIRRPTDGDRQIAPDHVFGETTELGMSEAKSDHDYNWEIKQGI